MKKIRIIIFSLFTTLYIGGVPMLVQAKQSHLSTKSKNYVIPMLVLTFLNDRLANLSNNTEKNSLLENIWRLKLSPSKLTNEEKNALSQYIGKEFIQFSQKLSSNKDEKKLQDMLEIQQELIHLKDYVEGLCKTSVPQAVYRSDEILVPANGNCLYISIILGYLLPVVDNPKNFKKRLGHLTNYKTFPITCNTLARYYDELHYLNDNRAFQQVIRCVLKQINTKPGTWGGPNELRLIASKFKISIQVYTPDPDNLNNLIKDDLIQSKRSHTSASTIHIVQDVPLPQELVNSDEDPYLQYAKHYSLKDPQNRHHYRLYYTEKIPELSEEEEVDIQDNTNQPSTSPRSDLSIPYNDNRGPKKQQRWQKSSTMTMTQLLTREYQQSRENETKLLNRILDQNERREKQTREDSLRREKQMREDSIRREKQVREDRIHREKEMRAEMVRREKNIYDRNERREKQMREKNKNMMEKILNQNERREKQTREDSIRREQKMREKNKNMMEKILNQNERREKQILNQNENREKRFQEMYQKNQTILVENSKTMTSMKRSIDNQARTIKDKNSIIDKQNKTIKDLTKKAQETQQKILIINQSIQQLKNNKNNNNQRIQELEREKQELESKKNNLQRRIDNFNNGGSWSRWAYGEDI